MIDVIKTKHNHTVDLTFVLFVMSHVVNFWHVFFIYILYIFYLFIYCIFMYCIYVFKQQIQNVIVQYFLFLKIFESLKDKVIIHNLE